MKKEYINLLLIILIFGYILGFGLLVINVLDNSNYISTSIIGVEEGIVKVEAGEINGDPIIYEIKKPLYKELKIGDNIEVREKNGNRTYALINSKRLHKLSIALIAISTICVTFVSTYFILLIIYHLIIDKIKRN